MNNASKHTTPLWESLQNKYQKSVTPAPRSIWRNPIHFIACGFGTGAFPFMPGTIGTLAAIPLTLILSSLSWQGYLIACILLFILGVITCHITNNDFGTQDHPAAVIDELATFPVTLFALPKTWPFIIAAFILFRFFDIVKPGPIRWVDKIVHGGFGVMLDDLMAALITLGILHFFAWVL